LRILATAVRLGRDKEENEITRKIHTTPSCRATIKLMDHVQSKTVRSGREVVLLADYGKDYENVVLVLAGRIEVEFGVRESKKEIVKALIEEAMRRTSQEVCDKIPDERFDEFYANMYAYAVRNNGERYITIERATVENLRQTGAVSSVVKAVAGDVDDETFLSAIEMLIHSIAVCTPRFVERKNGRYVIRERTNEGRMRRV